jgi:hypothetical protein
MRSWSSLRTLHGRSCACLFLLLFVTVAAAVAAIEKSGD